jgi:hypothetical protein
MARLTSSRTGYKRRMQMAGKVTVFVFVEGHNVDPYFYGEICEPLLATAGYEIVRAWTFADSGGKDPLLGFYDYLAATNSLLATFQGKRLAAIFFLDKDLDDILHARRYSDHIIYTQHYAIENYLFVEGDLVRAAASASSLERRELAEAIGDQRLWRLRKAEAWREWVTLCIFAQKYSIGGPYNYRRAFSTINNPLDSPPDAATVQRHRAILREQSGMTGDAFERALRAVVRLVEGYYRRGIHDRLFRGKWYVSLLEEQIERVAAGRPYNSHALSNQVLAALGSTLDFSAGWVEHFRAPLRALVTRL